jgi:hypothetical protein
LAALWLLLLPVVVGGVVVVVVVVVVACGAGDAIAAAALADTRCGDVVCSGIITAPVDGGAATARSRIASLL